MTCVRTFCGHGCWGLASFSLPDSAGTLGLSVLRAAMFCVFTAVQALAPATAIGISLKTSTSPMKSVSTLVHTHATNHAVRYMRLHLVTGTWFIPTVLSWAMHAADGQGRCDRKMNVCFSAALCRGNTSCDMPFHVNTAPLVRKEVATFTLLAGLLEGEVSAEHDQAFDFSIGRRALDTSMRGIAVKSGIRGAGGGGGGWRRVFFLWCTPFSVCNSAGWVLNPCTCGQQGAQVVQRLVVAINQVTGQLVACFKHVLSNKEGGRAVLARVRELRKYRHLNICDYKTAFVKDGHIHVLMELCDFGSIASILLR
jgi:hypothetical protein